MGGDVAAVTPVLRPCHIPVTRRNGYGNVTGNKMVTRTRTRMTRTRKPARVLKPVPITTHLYIPSFLTRIVGFFSNEKLILVVRFCGSTEYIIVRMFAGE
jgi:hypothetical protein